MALVLDIFTDGGARGNPGPAAIGIHIESGGKTLFEKSAFLGVATNNVAEYEALFQALQWIAEYLRSLAPDQEKPTTLSFHLDSLLVVQQMKGVFKVKQPHILEYVRKAKQQIAALGIPAQFTHIPRTRNSRADALVNAALDAQTSLA